MSGKIGSKIASRLAGVCLLAIVLLAGSWRAAVAEEPWVPPPFIPYPELVYLQQENGTRFMNVTVDFPYLGMGVSWGSVKVSNSEVWVNAEMWYPAPIIIPCFETVTHLYYFATLQPGEYTFTFKVWDTPIKEIPFTFYLRPIDINGDGIIDIDDLARVGKAYGSQLGEPAYNPDADFNMDDRVDMRDLSLVGRCYGQGDP